MTLAHFHSVSEANSCQLALCLLQFSLCVALASVNYAHGVVQRRTVRRALALLFWLTVFAWVVVVECWAYVVLYMAMEWGL